MFSGVLSDGHARFPGDEHQLNTGVNPTWCLSGVYKLEIWPVHNYHRGGQHMVVTRWKGALLRRTVHGI